jgi:hypothetical protein
MATEEHWTPSEEDLDFRPHDLLLLRYGRDSGKLIGCHGELLGLNEHRHAAGFQTKSEAQEFIRHRARRYRGTLFFAVRCELLQALKESGR